MLYILFGRDKIGKKTVKDFIIKKYGLIIIPKYTDDQRKDWVVYNNFIEKRIICQQCKSDSSEFGSMLERVESNQRYKICSSTDDALLYMKSNIDNRALQGYTYVISKMYNDQKYEAKYYIKNDHIDQAIEDEKNDYLLVCSAGEVICEIKQRAESLGMMDKVCVVQIIGEQQQTNQTNIVRWNVNNFHPNQSKQPNYLYENQHNFLGTINNIRYVENGRINTVLFEKNISKQWEQITGMLPLEPSVFFVRPFTDENKINLNDEFVKLFKEKIKQIIPNISLKYVELKNDNNFDAIFNAIEDSQLILVDLDGYRHNCIYECGYARALAKFDKSKQIFTFVGIKTNLNYENTSDKEKIESELNKCDTVPYDLSPHPFYKYILYSKKKEIGYGYVHKLKFIEETNAVDSLENKMKKFLAKVENKHNVNIYDLIIK